MSRITKSPVNKRDLKLNYFYQEVSVNPLEINLGGCSLTLSQFDSWYYTKVDRYRKKSMASQLLVSYHKRILQRQVQ